MAKREQDSIDSEEIDRADAYRVTLDGFDGPLDLLLHLVRKHELDVLDIPIGFVTQKYLEYLQTMRDLTIDVASEYLVMAATLTLIKSRMLLPREPGQGNDDDGPEEEVDPRADLVRRLLAYQKYKQAAEQLHGRPGAGRDMYERGSQSPMPEGPAPFAPVTVFRLFDVFSKVLERSKVRPTEHQVEFEPISISDRMVQLTELLTQRRRMGFEELLFAVPVAGEAAPHREPSRFELIITFLAVLEMCKMRVARITQDESLEDIVIEFHAKRLDEDDVPLPTDIGRDDHEAPAERSDPEVSDDER